jgi:hypothetical protein
LLSYCFILWVESCFLYVAPWWLLFLLPVLPVSVPPLSALEVPAPVLPPDALPEALLLLPLEDPGRLPALPVEPEPAALPAEAEEPVPLPVVSLALGFSPLVPDKLPPLLPTPGAPGSLRMVSVEPADVLALLSVPFEPEEPLLLQAEKITMAENANKLCRFMCKFLVRSNLCKITAIR